MPALAQILLLLIQLFPEALRAIKAWEEYHGEKLDKQRRQQLANDIKTAVRTAVETKNTAGLEDAIKTMGKLPEDGN